MSKLILLPIFTIIITFSSCITHYKAISEQKPTNNPTYEVAYLFEHEGCKVYRFLDGKQCVYFTNCNGEAMVFDTTSVIKNTTIKN
jgi:Domain of unknown function (DUF4884)